VLAGGILAALWLGFGTAPASAACYGPREQLAAEIVTTFIANPAQMLQQFPSAGGLMITRVRDLAASNPAALRPIIQLLANANPEQKRAIGAGLAQAARICVRTEQAYATEIQNLLAATKDQEAILAFAAVAGDRPIEASGAGGGFSGGASGGPTTLLNLGGGGSSLQPPGNFGTPTLQFTISAGVSGGAGFSSSTNINVSVSP
jgi:hypothetical protein